MIFFIITFCNIVKSQNAVDSIFGPYSGRAPLYPLVHTTDSLRWVYIDALMKWISNTDYECCYSGYTNQEERKRNLAIWNTEDIYRYTTKGVVAIYLIYAVILKDTSFVAKIKVKHRCKKQFNNVQFFKKQKIWDRKKIYEYDFVGRRHQKRMVKKVKQWYKINKGTQIKDVKLDLPLAGSKYSWSSFNYYESIIHRPDL
jgi:hypothetical protein